MNARILAATSFLTALAGSLPAADPQLLKLVMPDAKAVSDVNFAQAVLTPFGQFALGQLTNPDIQKLITLTGFDPSKDLNEVLCASNGEANTGLVLATGIFDPVKIGALAAKDGAVTETYQGVTILVDPKKGNGVAFLNAGLMAAGDIANVKAAIGRQSAPTTLPDSLMKEITMLSNTEDAWALTTVSPASLHPAAPANKSESVNGVTIPPNVFQQVQSGYAGVKFGSNITVTAQAQTADAQSATNLAGMLQLLQNFALMQASQNPDLAAFARSISVTAQGTAVNFSASLPEEQFQALIKPKAREHSVHKK
ncbi:MAG: hypothetical protein WBY44_18115 [Bryobacteraceae bacterium]|jgi:hypothetical protein